MSGDLSLFGGFVMRFGMLLIVFRMFKRNGVSLILMFGFFGLIIYFLLIALHLYTPVSQFIDNTSPPPPPTP